MSIIFTYLDIVGPLLALLSFLFKNKTRSQSELILICFLVLQLLANSLAKVMMLMYLPNNIYVYQANAFFSCVVVGIYFVVDFKKSFRPKLFRWIQVYLMVSFILLLLIIFQEGHSYFNSISYPFTGFTVCVLSVTYYLHSLYHVKDETPVKTSRFWAVTAFFIYYSTSFFIFLYYRILSKMPTASSQVPVLWGIHNFVLFVSCLLLIKASKHQ